MAFNLKSQRKHDKDTISGARSAHLEFKQFDLNLLRVFLALLQTGSATKAATMLQLTQPAVSNALRRLRSAFNDPLFISSQQGMRPTEVALKLAQPVKNALDTLHKACARQKEFNPRASRRLFRLCASNFGQATVIVPLLLHLAETAPGLRVTTVNLAPKDGYAAMANGDIDLFIGFSPASIRGIIQEKLFDDRYVCLARNEHPHIRPGMAAEQFLETPYVQYIPTTECHDVLEQALSELFRRHRRKRTVPVRLDSFLGFVRLILNSDMATCVPESFAQGIVRHHQGIAMVRLPFDVPPISLCQSWHRLFDKDPANIWLRQTLKKIAASLAPQDAWHEASSTETHEPQPCSGPASPKRNAHSVAIR